MSDRSGQFLVCRAATLHLAIPIEDVIETMRALPISSLVGAPWFLRGITVIRGDPLPVVDPARFLEGESSQAVRLVTVRAAERCVALAVDEVLGLQEIARERLQQLPPLFRDSPADGIAALGILDGELLLVLQRVRCWPESVWSVIDEGAVAV